MTVDVVEVSEDQFDDWDGYVDRFSDATLFHRSDALELQAAHTGTDPHLLVGYEGQESVGIFPIFERREGPVTGAFSPATPLEVQWLGPATIDGDGFEGRSAERMRHRFVERCLEWMAEEVGAQYFSVLFPPAFEDLRPLKWDGADVTPKYTYVVDLTPGEEELLRQFSQNARRAVRDDYDTDYSIEEGGVEDVRRILAQVESRYGDRFRMPSEFAVDLFERLPEGSLRPYVCRTDDGYVGGILTYEYGDRIRWWHGGITPDSDVDLPVNDLLNWHIMLDARERGIERYDLGGAAERRLTDYKTKFAPSLETHYNAEGGWWPVKTLVDLYTRVR